MTSVRKISNDIFFAQVMEFLEQGESATIMVSGRSMSPTFKDGVDRITISPFNPDELKKGDVVLFNRGDTICVHRIIKRKGDRLVIRGDGNSPKALEYAKVTDVMGIITAGTMYGGHPFKTTDSRWKRNTSMIFNFFPVLAFWHRIKFIVCRYPMSLLTFAVLLYLSLFNPIGKNLPSFDNSDKVAHVLMYLGVSLVFWCEWLKNHSLDRRTYKRGLVRCLLFPIVLGGLLELFQEYCLDYRGGDLLDFAANCSGALVALVLAFAVIIPMLKSYRARHA